MRLRELEIFNALMKARTTTGAADLLGVSQPAISKAIKHLESHTGLALFDRVRGRLHPTPAAQTLYKNVANVFARLETVDRIAKDLRGGRGGIISVAATPSLGSSLLANSVVRFRRQHPETQIIFRSITSHDVARRVAGGEADFGTVHSKVDMAGLEAEALTPAEVVCILPRGHLLADRAFLTLEDLLPYPLISYRPGTPIGTSIAQAFQAAGHNKPIDVQTSLSSTACLLTAQGAGVAVTDPFALVTADCPSLVVRALRPRIAIGINLLFSRENPSSGIAMKLAQHMRIAAAEMAETVAQRTGLSSADPDPLRRSKKRTTNALVPVAGRERDLAAGADPTSRNHQAGSSR
jgi:DNA-binding transcriptional LysR family regulator